MSALLLAFAAYCLNMVSGDPQVEFPGYFHNRPKSIHRVSGNAYTVTTYAGEVYRCETSGFQPTLGSKGDVIDGVSLDKSLMLMVVRHHLVSVSLSDPQRKLIILARRPDASAYARLVVNRDLDLLAYIGDSRITWYRIKRKSDNEVRLAMVATHAFRCGIGQAAATETGAFRIAVTLNETHPKITICEFDRGRVIAKRMHNLPEDAREIRYSPNGKYLCIARDDGSGVLVTERQSERQILLNNLGRRPFVDVDDWGDVVSSSIDDEKTTINQMGKVQITLSSKNWPGWPTDIKILRPGFAVMASRPGFIFYVLWPAANTRR